MDLKAKKAELEEQGLVATHQTAMAHLQGQALDERLKQMSIDLDMAEQKTAEAESIALYNEDPAGWERRRQGAQQAVDEAADANSLAENAVFGEIGKTRPADLPPAYRSIFEQKMRGGHVFDTFGADFRNALVEWNEQTGEGGVLIGKGSAEFEAFAVSFIQQHKADNNIIEGSPADSAYNGRMRAYFETTLPTIKAKFLKAHKLEHNNNEEQLFVDELLSQGVFSTAPRPATTVLGPGGKVVRVSGGISEAMTSLLNGTNWASVSQKTNDGFDLFTTQIVTSLIHMQSHEALFAARNFLNLSDADFTHNYRGKKFSKSNHYRKLMDSLDAAEEGLETKDATRVKDTVTTLTQELEPYILRKIATTEPSQRATLFAAAQAGVGSEVGSWLDLFPDLPSELAARILGEEDGAVWPLLSHAVYAKMAAVQSEKAGAQTAMVESILGVDRELTSKASAKTIRELVAKGGGMKITDDLMARMGMASEEVYATSNTTMAAINSESSKVSEELFNSEVVARARDSIQPHVIDLLYNITEEYKRTHNGEAPSADALQLLARPGLIALHHHGFLNKVAEHFDVLLAGMELEEAAAAAGTTTEEKTEDDGEVTTTKTPTGAWTIHPTWRQQIEIAEKRTAASKEKRGEGTPEQGIFVSLEKDKLVTGAQQFADAEERNASLAEEQYTKATKRAEQALTNVYVPRGDSRLQPLYPTYPSPWALPKLNSPQSVIRQKKTEEKQTALQTDAYRNKISWGVGTREVIDTINTRSINGNSVDGFTLKNGESYLTKASPSENRPSDLVVAPDTFKDIKPPLTDLPASGVTRDQLGITTGVDVALIEKELGITRAESELLAKNYGFVGEGALEKFYTHQYDTPYHHSRWLLKKDEPTPVVPAKDPFDIRIPEAVTPEPKITPPTVDPTAPKGPLVGMDDPPTEPEPEPEPAPEPERDWRKTPEGRAKQQKKWEAAAKEAEAYKVLRRAFPGPPQPSGHPMWDSPEGKAYIAAREAHLALLPDPGAAVEHEPESLDIKTTEDPVTGAPITTPHITSNTTDKPLTLPFNPGSLHPAEMAKINAGVLEEPAAAAMSPIEQAATTTPAFGNKAKAKLVPDAPVGTEPGVVEPSAPTTRAPVKGAPKSGEALQSGEPLSEQLREGLAAPSISSSLPAAPLDETLRRKRFPERDLAKAVPVTVFNKKTGELTGSHPTKVAFSKQTQERISKGDIQVLPHNRAVASTMLKAKDSENIISTDFNDATFKGRQTGTGIEVVLPGNASSAQIASAKTYLKLLNQFMLNHGVKDNPLRSGKNHPEATRQVKIPGIWFKKNTRRPRMVYTEPFFAAHTAARKAIEKNPREYARIILESFGGLPGVVIIPPHTKVDPGATFTEGKKKVSEQAWSKKFIIPHLQALMKEGTKP